MGALDVESIPRRTMVLFFLIDTSGSMAGRKIGSVNTAISEIIPELKQISAENADAQIKIAVLTFSSGTHWLYDKPLEAENFHWNDIKAGGLTDLGDACQKLNEKLSRTNGYMNEVTGSFAPVFLLLTDGEPTDDYGKGLAALKQNNWFKAGIKIAIAIGDDANTETLKEFTGNIESVLTSHDPDTLRKMIRFASITASQIGSKSSTTGVVSKQDEVIKSIKENLPNVTDVQSGSSFGEDNWYSFIENK
jgi:uncharacterized protein YegL